MRGIWMDGRMFWCWIKCVEILCITFRSMCLHVHYCIHMWFFVHMHLVYAWLCFIVMSYNCIYMWDRKLYVYHIMASLNCDPGPHVQPIRANQKAVIRAWRGYGGSVAVGEFLRPMISVSGWWGRTGRVARQYHFFKPKTRFKILVFLTSLDDRLVWFATCGEEITERYLNVRIYISPTYLTPYEFS